MPVINVPGATGSSGMANMLAGTPGQSIAVLIQDTLATVPAGSASFDLDEIRAVCRMQSMPSALFVRKGDLRRLGGRSPRPPRRPTTSCWLRRSGPTASTTSCWPRSRTCRARQFRAVPFSEPGERFTALLSGEVDALYEQLGDVRVVPRLRRLRAAGGLRRRAGQGLRGRTAGGRPRPARRGGAAAVPWHGDQCRGHRLGRRARCRRRAARRSRHPPSRTSRSWSSPTPDSYQDAEEFQKFLRRRRSSSPTQLEEYGLVED